MVGVRLRRRFGLRRFSITLTSFVPIHYKVRALLLTLLNTSARTILDTEMMSKIVRTLVLSSGIKCARYFCHC